MHEASTYIGIDFVAWGSSGGGARSGHIIVN
jgi:hypothetical protein